MCMTTIYREGDYELVNHSEGLAPYAIFTRADGFWQQVSKWYFYKGCALRELRKQLREDELRGVTL